MRQDRLLAADQALRHHVDGDLERRLGGALAGARLQHPQAAVLDGEFQILHVAVVAFEPCEGRGQVRRRSPASTLRAKARPSPASMRARFGDVLRRADAGDDVLALRIDQEFAVERLFAGRGIAGEGDAGRRGLAQIAEHHGLDVDGRAPVAGNAVEACDR